MSSHWAGLIELLLIFGVVLGAAGWQWWQWRVWRKRRQREDDPDA